MINSCQRGDENEPENRVSSYRVGEITPYARNAKQHPQEQVEQIKRSIEEFGFNDPLALWHGEIVEGHGRYLAAIELGLDTLPVIKLDKLTDEQRRAYALVHNKLTMNSGFDLDLLNIELADIANIDMSDFGFGSDDGEDVEPEKKGSLADRYLVPPFSVIYGNKPDWLARKRAWVNFGIRSEIGRGGDLLTIQGAIQRQTSYQERERR